MTGDCPLNSSVETIKNVVRTAIVIAINAYTYANPTNSFAAVTHNIIRSDLGNNLRIHRKNQRVQREFPRHHLIWQQITKTRIVTIRILIEHSEYTIGQPMPHSISTDCRNDIVSQEISVINQCNSSFHRNTSYY